MWNPGHWTKNDHFSVFESILQQVVLLGHPQAPVKPVGMGGTPVPALPAVRVVQNRGEFQQVHKTGKRPHFIADNTPVVVEDVNPLMAEPPYVVPDAFDLTGDNIQGFVPGKSFHRLIFPDSADCVHPLDRNRHRFRGYLIRSSEYRRRRSACTKGANAELFGR